jgi:hypothetical protein
MEEAHETALPPRLRRVLEVTYLVEGVTAARIWQWDGRIAIAIRVSASSSAEEVLARVMSAVAPLREVDEAWEFGLLAEP